MEVQGNAFLSGMITAPADEVSASYWIRPGTCEGAAVRLSRMHLVLVPVLRDTTPTRHKHV